MAKSRRKPFTDYEEAFEAFTSTRRDINDIVEKKPENFYNAFLEQKAKALSGDVVAMDVLAYYYKNGIPNILPENYHRYIQWEMIAASWGNELAIEKLQFLLGRACEKIMDDESYSIIEYKNDIDDYNALYVLGKAIAKILVRDFFKCYLIDLVEAPDEPDPFKQEYYTNLRKDIESAIPLTVEFLKS